MKKIFLAVAGMIFFVLGIVFPVFASISYDLANSALGEMEAFPMRKGLIEEKLGKADFTEEIYGFPVPAEVYIIEGSEEVSHIYFIYGAGEKGEETFALGLVSKGVDLSTMLENILGMFSEEETPLVLQGEGFAVLESALVGLLGPLWALFEERMFQGEKSLFSTLIPPENLFSYFQVAYQDFAEPLLEAIEERLSKD